MARGVGIQGCVGYVCSQKPQKMGASPPNEGKKTFYMVAWTCNVGIGNEWSVQGQKCVLDRGHKGICTLESFGFPKSNFVSPGVLYAYLSGVQRRTCHIQWPTLAAPDLVSNTQKN